MKDKFEISLLESGEIMKNSATALVNNIGRVIAVLTFIVSALVLFTDINFTDFKAEAFTSTLAIMLIASYMMYFSMSEAGEKSGEKSEEYRNVLKKYTELAGTVSGDKIASLREFCKEYSEDELKYRRENLLMQYGLSPQEYDSYRKGGACDKASKRIFRRADRLKAIPLTPKTLLGAESSKEKSELQNPEKTRFISMLTKLIPSTVCMTVTVSVMLTTKDNLSLGVIFDGLFKLASLLIIGFKGYVSGHNYKKYKVSIWIETKTRLLDAFLKTA